MKEATQHRGQRTQKERKKKKKGRQKERKKQTQSRKGSRARERSCMAMRDTKTISTHRLLLRREDSLRAEVITVYRKACRSSISISRSPPSEDPVSMLPKDEDARGKHTVSGDSRANVRSEREGGRSQHAEGTKKYSRKKTETEGGREKPTCRWHKEVPESEGGKGGVGRKISAAGLKASSA